LLSLVHLHYLSNATLQLYFSQGRRKSLESNKVKKGINATATVGQEFITKVRAGLSVAVAVLIARRRESLRRKAEE